MPITETNVEDIRLTIEQVNSMSLRAIKAQKDYIPRALGSLGNRLSKLQSAELSLLQKVNRLHKLSEMEQFAGDRFVRTNPIQSFEGKKVGTPDPDDRITHNINRMQRYNYGVRFISSEVEKIRYEVGTTSQKIKNLEYNLNLLNERVAREQERGRLRDLDIEADHITDMKIKEVMALYEIYLEYVRYIRKNDSTDGYSEDPKVVRRLSFLNQKFVALAKRNSYVLSGDLVLNLDDIWVLSNQLALENLLERLRGVSVSTTKTFVVVTKFGDYLNHSINDLRESLGLSRKKDPTREPQGGDSFKQQTNTFSKFLGVVASTGATVWTTLEFNSATEATKKYFRTWTRGLHQMLPLCGVESSGEEAAREEAQNQQDQTESQGAEEYQILYDRIGLG